MSTSRRVICRRNTIWPPRNHAPPLAPAKPRHLSPQPKAPTISPRTGLDGVIDSLLFAQHAIEMFRRSLPEGSSRKCLDRLSNRLTKILAEARKLNPLG